jgi:uncharacterized protein YejL (UPF0352 family)
MAILALLAEVMQEHAQMEDVFLIVLMNVITMVKLSVIWMLFKPAKMWMAMVV